jgi:hypothetical protein
LILQVEIGPDQANLDGDQSKKVRARASQFQSLEEAEQALLGFDVAPITGRLPH